MFEFSMSYVGQSLGNATRKHAVLAAIAATVLVVATLASLPIVQTAFGDNCYLPTGEDYPGNRDGCPPGLEDETEEGRTGPPE